MSASPSSTRCIAAALALACTGAAPAGPSFVPVYETNFPDAFVVVGKDEFVAYSTNSDNINLPMASSRDLISWRPVLDSAHPGKPLDGMPALGAWAKPGLTWAPEVMKIGSRWVLYYTARNRAKNLQCVGTATALDARGPFRDVSPEPMVCQADLGGTIDASPFRDGDGNLYLYYKNDGNAVGKGSWIWGQRMAGDGLSTVGAAAPLIRDDQPWENKLVEAPTMVLSPGGYRLFYSAAFFGWNADERLSPYATGYATCSGPLGPCKDSPDNPILHSFNDRQAGCLSGPGHTSVFNAAGRSFITFHAWAATKGCRRAADRRYLYIAPLSWKNGKPVIGPSLRPAGH